MLKKILVIMLILSVVFTTVSRVTASSLLNDIVNQGSSFGNKVNSASDKDIANELNPFIRGKVKNAIWAIGNLIFAAVTVILGVKFIWSGAEGKSEVQESLPNFVVAVIFFYLANPLLTFITGTTSGITAAATWQELSGNFIWIVNTIVKYLALAGLIYVGIKYLLASAEGKASLKTNMGGVVIGILFVFLASNVVNFIIQMGNDVLTKY